MNQYRELADLMQKEIDNEQLPHVREKRMSEGLKKAKEIINEYASKNNFYYVYSMDGLKWHPVRSKSNINLLLKMGYIIKRDL